MNQFHFPRGKRIAVIESGWFHDIVKQGTEAFLERLSQAGIPRSSVDVVTAPGAFEIPLKAKRLAKSGNYAAIVGCALVADGGIYRHDFVSATVIQGLMDVQLMTDVPVFSVVLTPHHFHEHQEHQEFFHRHFLVKGKSAAEAVIQTFEDEGDFSKLVA